MQILIKKWGNSASVRIPAAIMAATHLHLDDAVDVREEDGRIIIEPVRLHTYNLEELLAGITKENRHDVIDFGPAIGKETF